MDNFLTLLYSKYFDAINEEKKHRNIHDFDSDVNCARNDEHISCTMSKVELIKELITKYSRSPKK